MSFLTMLGELRLLKSSTINFKYYVSTLFMIDVNNAIDFLSEKLAVATFLTKCSNAKD